MVLKNNGKHKKRKIIKCDKCNEKFELEDSEIIKIAGIRYVSCPFCGQDILL